MEIGLLGATGPAGIALAARLADAGHDVVVGSRSKYRAMEVCDKIFDRWPERSLSIRATDNAGAADAEVVVIATPWDAAAATARSAPDPPDRTHPAAETTARTTTDPTTNPTMNPTTDPTAGPTSDPTTEPTMDPTSDPTMEPTWIPTSDPTMDPTMDPTSHPTASPPRLCAPSHRSMHCHDA